jgi:hypothetical protein
MSCISPLQSCGGITAALQDAVAACIAYNAGCISWFQSSNRLRQPREMRFQPIDRTVSRGAAALRTSKRDRSTGCLCFCKSPAAYGSLVHMFVVRVSNVFLRINWIFAASWNTFVRFHSPDASDVNIN